MESWLVYPTAMLVFLWLFLQVNLYIDLHFCRRKDNDFIAVTVYALKKLLIYSIKIPAIEIKQYNNLPWITSAIQASHAKTKTRVEREQRFVKKAATIFIHNPRRFLRLLRISRKLFRSYRYYTNRLTQKMHCNRLEIKIVYGFEDAAVTGIMMGIFASMLEKLLRSLPKRLIMDTEPGVKLMPMYGCNYLEVEVRCIFRIRLGNVITASMARLVHSSHKEATRSG